MFCCNQFFSIGPLWIRMTPMLERESEEPVLQRKSEERKRQEDKHRVLTADSEVFVLIYGVPPLHAYHSYWDHHPLGGAQLKKCQEAPWHLGGSALCKCNQAPFKLLSLRTDVHYADGAVQPLTTAYSTDCHRRCCKQQAQYTCPRCHKVYCSSACYKEHSNTCSEAFYRYGPTAGRPAPTMKQLAGAKLMLGHTC
jgi:uncharacterized C2H2 Zn-finger protein